MKKHDAMSANRMRHGLRASLTRGRWEMAMAGKPCAPRPGQKDTHAMNRFAQHWFHGDDIAATACAHGQE